MSSYINCCSLPYKKNSTDIKTWLTALPAPDYDCGVALPAHSLPKERTDTKNDCYDNPYDVPACGTYGMGKGEWPKPYPTQTFESLTVLTGVTFTYSGTTITATKTAHGMIIGNEPFTISGQIGTNAVLNGSWVVASVVDENRFTFGISTEPTAALTAATLDFRHQMDFCTGHGFKAVHAKKYWQGRYGFVSDYVANPKVDTKYRGFAINSMSYNEQARTFSTTSGIATYLGQASMECSSIQSLTVGGVLDCSGSFNSTGFIDIYTELTIPPSYISVGGTLNLLKTAGTTTTEEEAQTFNKTQMINICAVNADRGIVTCNFPYFVRDCETGEANFEIIYYQGTPENFQNFLFDLVPTLPCDPPSPGSTLITLTGSISLTETTCTVSVAGTATQNSDPISANPVTFIQSFGFDITISLNSAYTAAACQTDALVLLNQWDMTDDAVYPWRTDSNCNVAPMVIRKEINGNVGFGYCETPADSLLLSTYDGSIYGAPLPAAYYDKGWFDFYEQEYHYIDSGAGCDSGGSLCYTYGNYAPSYLPTTTTHWTDGASDTSCRPIANFQPFTRFKENYVYDTPVFVNNSCAFVQNNQEAFWAGKWAEIKEPLPSQNYWGICGVQPNQCATDSHGTGFGITCPSMRDLKVLDAETCEITGTDRYPTAFSICGKAAIVSINRDSGSGIVTVVHASTPLLRTGDAVDFINAGDTVMVSNVTVTVDSNTQFHFTGSLPTGNFIVSHGATGFSFYDLAPKGYFVRTSSNKYVVTAEEGNVQSTGAKMGIIAILPHGSPELSSPKWPARSTAQYTDYPSILPTESWLSSINQAMSDRFWIPSQDTKISDGGDPAVCVAKNQDGTPCDPLGDPCVPLITPLVEARLHAPTGAPLQFTSDNLTPTPQWYKLPGQTDWSFSCSNVWNYGESLTAFTNQYGVANNYGDSLNTTGISTDTDTGWGLADQYFIP